MHVFLAVTYHLHFWQNDWDLLQATAVTCGCNGYQNKNQHRKLTLEKKILPPLLLGLKPMTFWPQVWHSSTELSLLPELQCLWPHTHLVEEVTQVSSKQEAEPFLQTLHTKHVRRLDDRRDVRNWNLYHGSIQKEQDVLHWLCFHSEAKQKERKKKENHGNWWQNALSGPDPFFSSGHHASCYKMLIFNVENAVPLKKCVDVLPSKELAFWDLNWK